jgi:hypothetical protein
MYPLDHPEGLLVGVLVSHSSLVKPAIRLPTGAMSITKSFQKWRKQCKQQNSRNFHPSLTSTRAVQIVLRPGEVLYCPHNWFHYIVSLDMSIQCNTRSGIPFRGVAPIKKCEENNRSFQ